ncbi:neuronal acetylcholine receptor subunit beta-3-like [Ruditapes philippinarum]|uniref:neuronal acetylcholine receptor subunit beta-3-like n=1 Tax=Ruditapes philippinarum TaxID=129788 RepID=UPI00295BF080|nr:neuronal acetylcholine receptor subunit beta-3-like [Ruditapes philippinarum]
MDILLGQTYDEAVTLLRNKTISNEKSIRPVHNQSSRLDVYIIFDIVSIIRFEEVHESLTVVAGLTQTWTDEFVNWNPDDHGGMKDIVTESGNFWKPDLILVNSVNKFDKLGESWQRIRFNHNGLATVIEADTLSVLCMANLENYPFGDHWCSFQFSSIIYSPTEMSLHPVLKEVITRYFVESGTWNLIGSDMEQLYDNATVVFRINLARRPRFVLTNVVLPIIAMTFLNVIIFLIPVESGERMSYNITVLLAIAVFLSLVGENLPQSSKHMPVFSFYLLTILLMSVVITIVNIYSLRLYYRKDTGPTNGLLETVTRNIIHHKEYNRHTSRKVENTDVLKEEMESKSKEHPKQAEKGHVNNGNNKKTISPLINRTVIWKEVSNMIDIVSFVVFNIFITVATSVFFIVVCTSGKNKSKI